MRMIFEEGYFSGYSNTKLDEARGNIPLVHSQYGHRKTTVFISHMFLIDSQNLIFYFSIHKTSRQRLLIRPYIAALKYVTETDRIFRFTKSYLHHEMRRGCSASGVKHIRIHGIRHSHTSLLIDMGFSAVAIADRVGHESIDITYRYAHVFPSTQMEVVSKLNNIITISCNCIEK